MKRIAYLLLLLAATLPSTAQEQLAIWTFNDGLEDIFSGTDIFPTSDFVVGLPTVEMFFQTIDDNGSDGVDYTDIRGIFRESPMDNDAIRWDDIRGSGTDGELRIRIDTTGYEDITIRWDYLYRNNNDSTLDKLLFEYSTNGGVTFTTWTTLLYVDDDTWRSKTLNLSGIPAIENSTSVVFRIILDPAAAAADEVNKDVYYDNIEIRGDLIPAGSQDPVLTVNQALTVDRLNLRDELVGQVNGTIGDPTDPAAVDGIYFSTTDPQNDLIFLSATSSNQSVVPDSNLTLSFINDAIRRLQIEPAGVGTARITVTLSETGSNPNTDTYYIDYAASAASSTPMTSRYHTVRADASTGVEYGDNLMIVADDEDQTIRLFSRDQSGYRLKAWNFKNDLGLASFQEADLEASLKAGNSIYWMGSHANKKSGNDAPEREVIFLTTVSGAGLGTSLTYQGKYTGLEDDLVLWDATNGHGLGFNALGLAASRGPGMDPEQVDGFNIEALARMPGSSTRAYIGFRAPLTPGSGRTNALVIPVTNLNAIVTGASSTATFGAPIEMDLGGRGIRSMTRNDNDEYLILAGPPGGSGSFALYLWDGNAGNAPVQLSTDINNRAINADASPEGLLAMSDTLDACTNVQVLMDGGDTVLYNDGFTGKNHPVQRFRKFRSDLVALPAQSNEFVVTTTDDNGNGSLRKAIECANDTPGGQSIVFDLGTGPETIKLDSPITITDAVKITGPQDLTVTLSGQQASRIFTVTGSGGGIVRLFNLRFQDGFTTGDGGALRVEDDAEVRVRTCEFVNNEANGRGGAIYVEKADLTVRSSTLSGNTSGGNGGAINANSLSTLFLTQSTLSGNKADDHGGGLFAVGGEVRVIQSTITDNQADVSDTGFDGGGIRRGGGSTEIYVGNTVIAENSDESSSGNDHPDVSGDFISLGNNLIGISDGSTGLDDRSNNDQAGRSGNPLDPRLSILQFNGGVMPTHKPLFNSPLVEAATDTLYSDRAWNGQPPVFDQRGNDRIQNARPDIGTIEFIPIIALAVYIDKFANESPQNNRIGTFRLTRDRVLNDLTVSLALVSQAGSGNTADFTLSVPSPGSASGTMVTIPAGESEILVTLIPVDDSFIEDREEIGLQLLDGQFHVNDPAFPVENISIFDNDRLVTSFGDSGPGSLREAVSQISPAGGGLIRFENSVLGNLRSQTVELTSPISINAEITIEGPEDNAAGVAIDGGGTTRLFEFLGSSSITLRNLTIQNGNAIDGAGILLSDNAELMIEDSALINNSAARGGGGIFSDSNAVLSLLNTTVSGNTSNQDGGGIYVAGTDVAIIGSTVTNNTADADNDGTGIGGGLVVISGTTVLESTIVAGNHTNVPSGTPDIAGLVTTIGGNLVGISNGTGGNPATFPFGTPNGNGDYAGILKDPVDPRLFPLALKGGPTPVHALGCGSLALDNGSTGKSGPKDQRGLPRIAGGGIDIGAYEHQYLDYNYWRDFTFPLNSRFASLYVPGFDFDGDGQANGLERILGSDPTDPSSVGRTEGTLVGNDLLLSFSSDFTLDPIHIGVEASADLNGWGNPGLFLIETCPSDPDQLNPTMSLSIPRNKPEVFGRVFYIP